MIKMINEYFMMFFSVVHLLEILDFPNFLLFLF